LLIWTLNHCEWKLKNEIIDIFETNTIEQLIKIREKCHLLEGEEVFQVIDFKFKNKNYKIEIGDPLYISGIKN
jgi:hypothetical protein